MADDATHGRERTTTASDESGRRTTGRPLSSKINEHKVLNLSLSPFTVIFDNTERTQRRPRCGEGVYRTSEALVRIGLNLIFQIIQFTSKGLLGKL